MTRPGELQNQLLEVGFSRYDGAFAAGQQANNKLKLDYAKLCEHPDLLEVVVGELVGLAAQYDPQFIVGVPDGATGFAALVAEEFEIDHVSLKKGPDKIDYANAAERLKARKHTRGVLLEDVINRRSTTQRALRVEHLAPRISAVIAVFDRGIFDEQLYIGKPINSVTALPIPAQLPRAHELWPYAS